MKAIIAAVSATALMAISGAANAGPVELVKKYHGDCLSCHAVDHKVVGPAWKDVAAKYKGDKSAEATLTEKVIKGGKGNWDKVTGGMSMTPHPSKPSKAEIGEIVAEILKL